MIYAQWVVAVFSILAFVFMVGLIWFSGGGIASVSRSAPR